MKRARLAWALVALLLGVVLVQNRMAFQRVFSAKEPNSQQGEYFAWEKTPDARYKQVKKNYFMNAEPCNNVIGVLNEASRDRPRSDWVLSQTTDSTFECWPASVDPNDYYRKYSGYSDQPAGASGKK